MNKEPITRSENRLGGAPFLTGTGLALERLLAHVGWAFEEVERAQPGHPYDVAEVVRRATRGYCEDFPDVSFSQAEAAIGYSVKQLFRSALKRRVTVLYQAFPLDRP